MQTEKSFKDRLNELRSLKDGWYDGDGKAPTVELLEWVENWYLDLYSLCLGDCGFPAVFPDFAGGLCLEWSLPRFQPSMDIEPDHTTGSFLCGDPDFEQEYLEFDVNLNDPEDLDWVKTLKQAFRRGDL